ncbi:aspartate kinase [Fructilactobacillus lindneri]|uniref:Aspartokinase n=2 Tax=Fructilactobacillus lindneri TaxID=53444 RepID=A0A0R2JMH0_9LACO|nr:aspartate kinase [Fructilactobacillus lindneri]ANZ57664.1 aspartate kinase [Fructilactobacillus lindneri]ANZ58934.1 aspartate kinase [Fructilactobacillus lindneri]KRN78400.1 aspartokinase [Fructilactobacillus lindneri DSM 20690 = JCM 11027]POG97961.1 aspartate kinase [Fructilactobacillus lindneri]POH01505.1 aspartate kinase [Fructilactobacillus lindneri]
MKVVKFGGSSLADGNHFEQIIKIIKADPERKAVVVSAPGTRFKGDIKVTDLLIQYANAVLANEDYQELQQAIIARYQNITEHFQLDSSILAKITQTIKQLPFQNYPNDDYLMAGFKAQGEYLNAYTLSQVLNQIGIKTKFMDPRKIGFLVSDKAQDAHVLPDTYDNLEKYPNTDIHLIFPGFFGITKDNQIATFSRGGSDITGSIVAKGLNASVYENFTDVNAIYSVDPHIVKDPTSIHVMTYREMRELSYAGFSVFHDEAIIPAIEAKIPINVKNTSHPELPGTMIIPENEFEPTNLITGVASSKGFSALYLHRYLLNKEVGFTLKILQILYKYDVSYEHMPSGIDDLTIIFDNKQLTPAKKEKICAEINAALHPDQLEWIDNYAIIMIVGEGMQKSSATIENIIRPLTDHDIKIHMINQGASKIALMLGTDDADAEKSVKLIYQHFFDNNRIVN